MEIKDERVKDLMVPKFYTCPGKVIMNKELSHTSKLLYMIIFHLCTKQDCFATNEYFSTLLNISDRQVRNCLKELKDANFISVRQDKRARYISALVTFDIITPRNKNVSLDDLCNDYLETTDSFGHKLRFEEL